ncbi:tRNA 2'-phosphotransferase 1 [Latimeria chalumnae]|uniref:2'-phosphotransferase n=1 Tax=Latimeria chalumnae TaxID=7897 RepID=H3BBG8_LATCH|nr:PREDICTED: tRNA 2'-phosphotransferase 1 [Latimeria chalumnae]XP_005988909.1 PREDICTED: tRNA 2'-phosphotransferase 1 [Latimeria chalumnae]|eukprot:XP_005988908.1 PREDICTED: tRNA 2'-phosphotransferase 1 [Latimeria chalumnae]
MSQRECTGAQRGRGGGECRGGRSRNQRRHHHHHQDPDIRLSKALSYVLRHGASELGFQMGTDGFLYVDEILQHQRYRGYSEHDIHRVVETNDKQRFTLQTHPVDGRLQIRANQGHSIQVEDLELTPIEPGTDVPETAVHGTYLRHWESIRDLGLSRMSRRHIHLAPGLAGDGEVVSGMRRDCDLAIFIDIGQALVDGIKFFWSTNKVILTPGNEEGILLPKYFQKVLQLKPTRCLIPFEVGK